MAGKDRDVGNRHRRHGSKQGAVITCNCGYVQSYPIKRYRLNSMFYRYIASQSFSRRLRLAESLCLVIIMSKVFSNTSCEDPVHNFDRVF
jgi:hypothetical protein